MKIFEEYSEIIKQLSLKVIDDIANEKILKNISEVDSHHIIKKSELNIEKIPNEVIEKYENKYRIKIPEFVKFIMTDIGQSNLVCFWFFREGNIEKPFFYFSYPFFNLCLKKGISSDYLNDFNFEEMYENETNIFKDSQIQEVFTNLNSNDKDHIIKLLPTGHGDCSGYECVILNEVDNGLVVWTGTWHKKVHTIDDREDFQYDFGVLGNQIEDFCMTFSQKRLSTTKNLKDLIGKQKIFGFF